MKYKRFRNEDLLNEEYFQFHTEFKTQDMKGTNAADIATLNLGD